MQTESQALVQSFLQALFSKDMEAAAPCLDDSLLVENFFPHKGNKKSFLRATGQVLQAMENVKYEMKQVAEREGHISISFQVTGSHASPLDFSFMKLPVLEARRQRVAWPAAQWLFTVTDGKIVHIQSVGLLTKTGMPGILKSFGMKLPAASHLAGLLGSAHRAGRQFLALKPWRFLPLLPLGMLLFALFVLPSPINAAAWSPEPMPTWSGPLTPNNLLTHAERLGLETLQHPEDLAFDKQGRLYTGSDDGNIYRIDLDETGAVSAFDVFAHTGGYPLGLAFDASGRLLAAVKGVGLLAIDSFGKTQLLASQVNGSPITYANSLAIAQSGLVYFTDSSVKFERGWPYDVLEARPHGRLLAYHPNTGETELIKDDLYFPNGLVLAPDESYLLVAETTRYRISRYWLSGERRATWDIFAENLPILPDNLSRDTAGNYLLAGNRRLPLIDALHPHPVIKHQMAKIPRDMLLSIPTRPENRYGLVIVLGLRGDIRHSLHDPTGKVYGVSVARFHQGFLYLGTLMGMDIVRSPYHP